MSDPTAHRSAEPPADAPDPGPCSADGIRWELVNRMRRLIAAGQLDTPERWALAEEMLFRATDDRR